MYELFQKYFFPVVGMSSKNAKKVKLEHDHSSKFQFCFQAMWVRMAKSKNCVLFLGLCLF